MLRYCVINNRRVKEDKRGYFGYGNIINIMMGEEEFFYKIFLISLKFFIFFLLEKVIFF